MSALSRSAIAAVLVAGFGGIAQAQSHARPKPAPDRYYALTEDRGVVDPTVVTSGAVAPSESHTVMGLRVPR